MEANQNRDHLKRPVYWSDGNTARVSYAEEEDRRYHTKGSMAYSAAPVLEPSEKNTPERPTVTTKPTPNKAPKTQTHAKPRVDHNINFLSMCILVAAIAITLYTCISYLQVQSETIVITKDIRTLENQLTKLQDKNEATCNEVLDAINLDQVYQVAVQELGMVYPNQNKTVYYNSADDGYVRQFGDIPKEDKLLMLRELLH